MQVEKLSGNPKPLDILTKINQIIDKAIPVGFIYVQFPGESAPADLFEGEWTNISSQFAGQFFRAEGGNAASFGSSQGGGAPDISGYLGPFLTSQINSASGAIYFGFGSQVNWNVVTSGNMGEVYAHVNLSDLRSHAGYSLNEFRPANHTIRIWKRTA